ncbi:sugar nucleotide-binding protein [Rugosimonospora acidiphila]|uniref:Sugar nucleotide-binding protein n=1 Tax=Rugosimonospora acidiphila TaxID=556531 RepID=A0ABP9RU69_9ACTN
MGARILVTGGTGHLGSQLTRQAASAGWSVIGTYFTRPTGSADERLDIRDPAAVHQTMRRVRPDVVVHTAAGRDDWRVIADGAAHVAAAAAALGARLVHVSSDAIFSGDDVHYDEAAAPDPVYRYGAAKAAAETAVRAIAPGAAIVRTSLILGDGWGGSGDGRGGSSDGRGGSSDGRGGSSDGLGGHETLTHRLISGQIDGVLFTDQIRTPVHVADLADSLLELAAGGYAGVINVAGPDAISRYDLGVLVARRDGLDPTRLRAGRVADLGSSVPTDVRLRTAKARSMLRTRLRGAHEFMSAAPGTG